MWEQAHQLSRILPIRTEDLQKIPDSVEEIRISKGKPIRFCSRSSELELSYYADDDFMQQVLDRSTLRSPYGVMEMLRKGFLILPGGHRIGICGTGIYKCGHLFGLRDISSINIRIAKDITHIGAPIADTLWAKPGSALCIGPPGRGKTTLLRDVIRCLSKHYKERIAVIDERLELASTIDGKPQFDLGPTTDILSAVSKADGIDMVIRTMGPTWVALDEITAEEDVNSIIRGSYCGVRFIATAHGNSLQDLRNRPIYRRLLESRVFDYLFLIKEDRNIYKEELSICSV